MASKFESTLKDPKDYVLNGKSFEKNVVLSKTNKGGI